MIRLFKKFSNYLGYFQKKNYFFQKFWVRQGPLSPQVALPLV